MGDFFKHFESALENVATLAVENAANALDEHQGHGQETSSPRPRPAMRLSAPFEKKALEYWRDANIEGKRSGWNDKRLEIEQIQKADRSAPPTAQALRLRLTGSEALLLTLLDLLCEAPDPMIGLTEAAELEAKNAKLTKEVDRLQGEAGSAQKDSKEAQDLRDKVKSLETALSEAEVRLEDKSKELEEVVAAQATVNLHEIQERDAAQRAELASAQGRLKKMMEDHERTQTALFELTAKSEEERAAQAAQNDLAAAEVEQAQAQVAELERSRMELKEKLGALVDTEGTQEEIKPQPSDAALHSLEVMMAAKDHMITQLKDQLAQTTSQLGRTRAEAEAKVEHEREALRQAEVKAALLAKEIERRHLPEEVSALKKQIVSLASLVDSEMEAEGWMAEMGAGQADKATVSSWLQERNKKLADEVTSLKRQLGERAEQVTKLEEELAHSREDLREKDELVVNLEMDLERLSGKPASAYSPNREGATAEAGAEPSMRATGVAPQAVEPTSTQEAAEMLPIVVQQRDRFRTSLAKTHEELEEAQAHLAKVKGELETARADNVSLYEKIRYLESYSHQQAKKATGGKSVMAVDDAGVQLKKASSAARYSCGPLSVSVGNEDDDSGDLIAGRIGGAGLTHRGGSRYQCFGVAEDEETGPQGPEGRYRREYEDRLNPFQRFKHQEAAAGISSLAPSDRAVLAGGQLLAGSKMARIFVASYAALLHLIVFITLYTAAS